MPSHPFAVCGAPWSLGPSYRLLLGYRLTAEVYSLHAALRVRPEVRELDAVVHTIGALELPYRVYEPVLSRHMRSGWS